MEKEVFSHNLNALKYAEETSKKIELICSPLFLNLGFTVFAYIKVLSDGRMLHLNSNPNWTKIFFENEFYNEDDCFHRIRKLVSSEGDKTFILSGPPAGKHLSALYDFNIWNTYSIYKKREGYVEGWAFGTSRDKEDVINLYLKNSFIFNVFTLYFAEKAFDFTANAEDCNLIKTKKSINTIEAIDDGCIDRFLDRILPTRFPIKFRGKKIIFSKREIECLSLLSSGHSVKETAALLGISPRTAEDHINKMKLKIESYSKNDLIRMYLDNFDNGEIKRIYKSFVCKEITFGSETLLSPQHDTRKY